MFDGYRMLTRVQGPKDVRIFTRNGNDWTARFQTLQAELIAATLPPGWYDGEIVILDGEGKPNFNALQLAIEGKANAEIVYYLFDAPLVISVSTCSVVGIIDEEAPRGFTRISNRYELHRKRDHPSKGSNLLGNQHSVPIFCSSTSHSLK